MRAETLTLKKEVGETLVLKKTVSSSRNGVNPDRTLTLVESFLITHM
jgi:hypothetical protein